MNCCKINHANNKYEHDQMSSKNKPKDRFEHFGHRALIDFWWGYEIFIKIKNQHDKNSAQDEC